MMKKVISSILALTMAASVCALSASAMKGDVDNSGKVDIEDVVTVINHINGVKSLSGSAMSAADVDSSGNVDIVDAVTMINTINGIAPASSSFEGTKYDRGTFSYYASSDWSISTNTSGFNSLTYNNRDIPDAYRKADLWITPKKLSSTGYTNLKAYADYYVDDYLNAGFSKYYKYDLIGQSRIALNGYESYSYEYERTDISTDYIIKFIFVRNGDTVLVMQIMYPYSTDSSIRPKIQKVLDSIRIP